MKRSTYFYFILFGACKSFETEFQFESMQETGKNSIRVRSNEINAFIRFPAANISSKFKENSSSKIFSFKLI